MSSTAKRPYAQVLIIRNSADHLPRALRVKKIIIIAFLVFILKAEMIALI